MVKTDQFIYQSHWLAPLNWKCDCGAAVYHEHN